MENHLAELYEDSPSGSQSWIDKEKSSVRSTHGPIHLPQFEGRPQTSKWKWYYTCRKIISVVSLVVLTVFVLRVVHLVSTAIFGRSNAATESPNCSALFPDVEFHNDGSKDAVGCLQYIDNTKHIKGMEESAEPCPFQDPFCQSPVMAFDTGVADARLIGLESEETYRFRRKSSCSLIKMNQSLSDAAYEFANRKPPGSHFLEDISPPLPPILNRCGVLPKAYLTSLEMVYTVICPRTVLDENLFDVDPEGDVLVTLETTPICINIDGKRNCLAVKPRIREFICVHESVFYDSKDRAYYAPIPIGLNSHQKVETRKSTENRLQEHDLMFAALERSLKAIRFGRFSSQQYCTTKDCFEGASNMTRALRRGWERSLKALQINGGNSAGGHGCQGFFGKVLQLFKLW